MPEPFGHTKPLSLPADVSLRWLTRAPGDENALYTLLTDEERQRADGYRHAKRRREFILGRAAVRTLLAEHLDSEPRDVALRVAPDGALDVEGSEYSVSIAHSGNHAVAVVGRRSIGVDVEAIARRHPGLRRFLVRSDEEEHFDALPMDSDRALMLYWTLKESVLKAIRTGLRTSPKKIRLEVNCSDGSAVARVDDGRRFSASFEERDGYFVAVAFGVRQAPSSP